jgi:hypothetical protein
MAILPLSAIFPLKACTMANSLILDLQWDVRSVMQMVHALDNKDVFFQQSDHVFHTLKVYENVLGQQVNLGKQRLHIAKMKPFDFTLTSSALCVSMRHPPLAGCVKMYSDVATLRRGIIELGVLVCNNTGEIM